MVHHGHGGYANGKDDSVAMMRREEIYGSERFDDITVVVLKSTDPPVAPHTDIARNVIAYDSAGNIVWIIEEHPWTEGKFPYIGISRSDKGAVLYNMACFDLTVDPRTGRMMSAEPSK